MTLIKLANVSLRLIALAILIGVPMAMIAAAGTNWLFVLWFGGAFIGGVATMAAEYTEGLAAR